MAVREDDWEERNSDLRDLAEDSYDLIDPAWRLTGDVDSILMRGFADHMAQLYGEFFAVWVRMFCFRLRLPRY